MKKLVFLLLLIIFFSFLFPSVTNGQTPKEDSVYSFVPRMPQYPGGQKGIFAYLMKHMQYPLDAYIRDTTGTVFVSFIVEKDSSLSNVQIIRPFGFGCNEEAMRLVNHMEGWVPGELDGEKVRVRSTISVPFNTKYYPESQIYTQPDIMPEFPGGTDALALYLDKETQKPERAEEKNISGTVPVNFVVEKDGSVSNVIVMDSLGYGCDEEAVRVISQMPEWRPGMVDNKPVRTVLNLEVVFADNVFSDVEEMPEFPGGSLELMKYLASNVKYPDEAKNNGIQGRVFIKFVVDTDGSVIGARVLKGIGGGCDEEALRVIREMPKWTPGKQKEKPVKVSYVLSVKFTLN